MVEWKLSKCMAWSCWEWNRKITDVLSWQSTTRNRETFNYKYVARWSCRIGEHWESADYPRAKMNRLYVFRLIRISTRNCSWAIPWSVWKMLIDPFQRTKRLAFSNGATHPQIRKKSRWPVRTSRTTSISVLLTPPICLVNCWPNETANGGCDVNIEYELQNPNLVLKDVQISVPLP